MSNPDGTPLDPLAACPARELRSAGRRAGRQGSGRQRPVQDRGRGDRRQEPPRPQPLSRSGGSRDRGRKGAGQFDRRFLLGPVRRRQCAGQPARRRRRIRPSSRRRRSPIRAGFERLQTGRRNRARLAERATGYGPSRRLGVPASLRLSAFRPVSSDARLGAHGIVRLGASGAHPHLQARDRSSSSGSRRTRPPLRAVQELPDLRLVRHARAEAAGGRRAIARGVLSRHASGS